MITIRPATLADTGGFGTVVKAVAEERLYLRSTAGFAWGETQKYLDRLIRAGLPPILALDDSRVIGWCDVQPFDGLMRHGGELGIGLLPEWRGQGLGRKLMLLCLQAAQKAGLTRVELHVFESNQRAAALYRTIGFQTEGVLRRAVRLDHGEEDVLVMAILLDTPEAKALLAVGPDQSAKGSLASKK